MQWKYTLSEPVLGPEERDAVLGCLDSSWLSLGPRTAEFEERFALTVGARHAIAVSSGTAALHLALIALGVGTGDEVIQPSINFVAAANMTRALGAFPAFADIVSLTEPTIDPAEIRRLIGPRTKAIVAMHFGGYSARIAEILEICRDHGIALIEDACHAPGFAPAEHGGRSLGTFGDLGCFSFFSNKNITTAEGGMVVTDSDELARTVRSLRSHGMTTLSWDRHQGRPSTYDVVGHGFNYRIDDLRASLGLAQLDRLATVNSRRQMIAADYAREVGSHDGIAYIFGDRPMNGTAHLAGVVVDPACRDAIRQSLADRGIQTSLHYPPIHRFSVFGGDGANVLAMSEQFAASMITLPMHARLPDAAVAEIVRTIAEGVRRLAA